MLDFLKISERTRKGVTEVYPKFMIQKTKDLMIRGGDFYAIWIEERGLWSTDENDAIQLIDKALKEHFEKKKASLGPNARVLYLWDAETGMIDVWHKYCQKQMRDSFHMLDEKLIFSNDNTTKKDYATKRLNYPLAEGDISAYDKIISTLYSPEERHKIEWAIGSIVTGDSKKIQKFLVFYGAAGTGKSTILNIIQQLFEGYYSVFDARALGSSSNSFALEAFKSNPLVAIQHDGDLSKIEDNTRLNSLVSHELMTVNEKFKSTYSSRFKAFLFMGTNRPVKITDARSGLIRRLIDVTPTGEKIPTREYKRLMKQVEFELGGIACHCKEVYLSNPAAYDDYIPISMMGASNDFYNFVDDSYLVFEKNDGTTMKAAWEMYKTYCDDAKIGYPFSQRVFKEELKNYFHEFNERYVLEDGTRVRSYYSGFRKEKFESTSIGGKKEEPNKLIEFEEIDSIFDKECADCPAQYAKEEGTPSKKWEKVSTTLRHLDTSKLHYVKVPENHIVIDFDIPDENGNKCYEKNLEEASKWPPTYAELSKSGAGIHLHYIYTGDPTKLSRVYGDHIEVKVFTGNSSLRRKLTKCNNLPIAQIGSGLPLKKEKPMINFDTVQSEKGLRAAIKKNLNKEVHSATKPSVDYINKILEDAYNSGLNYDVTDMRNAVFAFAANSTNQADYCMKLVNKMRFKSEDYAVPVDNKEAPIVFLDTEVFPNLFLVNFKIQGEGKPVVRMINPKPTDIEALLKFRLIGFNNRAYDNHMLYACWMGYDNQQLYDLSTRLTSKDKEISRGAKFGEAFNLSYTDVYDFAATKQSLKKWEIELGIHHKELGLPWDQPVPEERWIEVAEYCDNDVIATEAVFNHLQADFVAREILADIAGMTVNDTTNSLTTKIIFGDDRNPQEQFNYRNMGITAPDDHFDIDDEYTRFDVKGRPVFPGYTYDKYKRKSEYRGEDPGEGGYVYANPGIYYLVALLDIASMHPSSIIAEQLFGKYTARFQEIKDLRVEIKHKNFEKAKTMLGGALEKYLDDPSKAKALAYALKIAINSVYGLTSAKFPNAFKDPRNDDNIVAKRGALFMINLKHQVEKRGYKVAHIKTDSIKIPNADLGIIQFVMEYGKQYGYTFEHEATYERMCLVNDAVYIAKYAEADACNRMYGYIPGDNMDHGGQWTATGAQFAVPYVFKTLFSKEPIEFDDMCETKSVKEGAMYLDMNENLPDVSEWENLKAIRSKNHDKLTKKDASIIEMHNDISDEDLDALIAEGHNYIFVGRVGQFTPVKEGYGGGILYRVKDGKNYAVTGTTGYRWLESEMVKTIGSMAEIDRDYYRKLVDDAASKISSYCLPFGDEPENFDDFVNGEIKIPNPIPAWNVLSDPLPESFELTPGSH